MLNKLARHIEESGLIGSGDQILVGISGGPDSVFLAFGLYKLGYPIGLAHVNYHQRGETSELEEKLVRNLGKEWEVAVHVLSCNPKDELKPGGPSFQMVARRQRYDFFDKLLKLKDYTICATAHHQDDQIETLLMSLIKGREHKIMSGIPERREKYIRPLFPFTKSEILEYLDEEKIIYSIDDSNFSNDYIRNRFRNEVIPILKDINPSLSDQLIGQYKWYKMQEEFLLSILSNYIYQNSKTENDKFVLDFQQFESEYGKALLPLLMAGFLEKIELHGGWFQHALKLTESESGKFVETPHGILFRTRTGLEYKKNNFESKPPIQINSIDKNNQLWVSWGDKKLGILYLKDRSVLDYRIKNNFYLDADRIQLPITVRNWKIGDKMKPLGMKNRKKLSDIFIDEKYSPIDKRKAIVFEDSNGIICLSDFRISDDVKITDQTKKILNIKIEP